MKGGASRGPYPSFGEIFQFRPGALLLAIKYVILMTLSRPDDLFDFAHMKGISFNEDPEFSIFLKENPNFSSFRP